MLTKATVTFVTLTIVSALNPQPTATSASDAPQPPSLHDEDARAAGRGHAIDAPRARGATQRGLATAFERPASCELQLGVLFRQSPTENTPLLLPNYKVESSRADYAAASEPGMRTMLAEMVRRRDCAPATPRHLLLCRSPKVGSTTLRAIAVAVTRGPNGRFAPIRSNSNTTLLPTIDKLAKRGARMYVLSSPCVRRMAFVRHPVMRILRGWYQMTIKRSAETFTRFVREQLLQHYDATCSNVSSAEWATNSRAQHYLPAQHCRCGMACGVEYELIRVEEMGVEDVLRPYLPSQHLPDRGVARLNSKRYKPFSAYVTEATLALLNELTAVEQRLLGYGPFVAPTRAPRRK